eukprot:6786626-Alexandrium_andersonii.AAC.1
MASPPWGSVAAAAQAKAAQQHPRRTAVSGEHQLSACPKEPALRPVAPKSAEAEGAKAISVARGSADEGGPPRK